MAPELVLVGGALALLLIGVLRPENEREAERKAVVLCPVEEGDIVVFHSLMLHRSGANRSKRSRWTVNPRFGHAADPAFADRGWLAVRDRTQTAFAQYYQEYVKVSGS